MSGGRVGNFCKDFQELILTGGGISGKTRLKGGKKSSISGEKEDTNQGGNTPLPSGGFCWGREDFMHHHLKEGDEDEGKRKIPEKSSFYGAGPLISEEQKPGSKASAGGKIGSTAFSNGK